MNTRKTYKPRHTQAGTSFLPVTVGGIGPLPPTALSAKRKKRRKVKKSVWDLIDQLSSQVDAMSNKVNLVITMLKGITAPGSLKEKLPPDEILFRQAVKQFTLGDKDPLEKYAQSYEIPPNPQVMGKAASIRGI